MPPNLFDATMLMANGSDFSAPSPASPGGILNYDMSASHTKGKTNTSGLLELGGFGSWGTAQTLILASDSELGKLALSGWILLGRETSLSNSQAFA